MLIFGKNSEKTDFHFGASKESTDCWIISG